MPNRSGRKCLTIHIRRKAIGGPQSALMRVGSRVYPCILGAGGITAFKREGDRSTPAGTMAGGEIYYRADRLPRPRIGRKLLAIGEDTGWCDDPPSSRYNCPVRLPFGPSHERLKRKDRLYDICVVLDWNRQPRRRNRGSAIFFHMTHPESRPTLGCIAVDPQIMRRLLPRLPRHFRFKVHL